MPFGVKSCCCGSNTSINSLTSPEVSTKTHHSSGGYVTNNKKVKISELKPPISCLHPRLRMSAEAYSQYKASMNSRETEPRRVHFRDDVLLKTEDDSGVISTPPKEAPRISALYDDDTDYVLFDEFEPFRQKLIKSKEGSSPSGKSDFSPTSNQPEKNCSLAEQEKLTTYDIPRGNPVPAIYDIPKKI